MKVIISIQLQKDTVPGSSTYVPDDMTRQDEDANLTISGYNYPGGLNAMIKGLTMWIEEHKDLKEINLEDVNTDGTLDKMLRNGVKKNP